MTFLAGWLQPADAVPDDGFAAMIVPVNAPEHFIAFATNDNLCKAVVAAVGALLSICTGLDHSSAYQFFLYSEKDVLSGAGNSDICKRGDTQYVKRRTG